MSHYKWVIMKQWEFFSHENILKGCTGPHKSSFSPYKEVSRINCDHEWLRIINVFILCDLFENFWKIMQQTEKEALIVLTCTNTILLAIHCYCLLNEDDQMRLIGLTFVHTIWWPALRFIPKSMPTPFNFAQLKTNACQHI